MRKKKAKIKYKQMPFEEQIAPFVGGRVKKIIRENDEIMMVFNDRFGSAMFFDLSGNFKCVGVTTKYRVNGNNPNKSKFYCRGCKKYYPRSKCNSWPEFSKGAFLEALVIKCPKGHEWDEK